MPAVLQLSIEHIRADHVQEWSIDAYKVYLNVQKSWRWISIVFNLTPTDMVIF